MTIIKANGVGSIFKENETENCSRSTQYLIKLQNNGSNLTRGLKDLEPTGMA